MKYLKKFSIYESKLSKDYIYDIKDILLELHEAGFNIEYKNDKPDIIGITIKKEHNREESIKLAQSHGQSQEIIDFLSNDDILFDGGFFAPDFTYEDVREYIARLEDYCKINNLEIKVVKKESPYGRHPFESKQNEYRLSLIYIFIHSK